MLKLPSTQTEPTWLDLLPGVRIQLKPKTVAMMLIAREAAVQIYQIENAAETKNPDVGTLAGIAMTRAYARGRIEAWEGIGDEAGEPAPVTPENIDLAMDVWTFHEAFDRLVLAPAMNAGLAQAA